MGILLVDVGDRLRLGNHAATASETAAGTTVTRAAFRDSTNAIADPTAATITIKAPDGTTMVATWTGGAAGSGTNGIIRESLGRYYLDYTVTQAGTHFWELAGSGTIVTVEQSQFYARPRGAA